METTDKRGIDMSYNSQRVKLLMPEYGRHVQNMLEHVKTVEDKETRQLIVEQIVQLMQQMQTTAKPSKELTEKLWNHVFMIAGYDLDVDAPEDVEIVKHTEDAPPPKLEYPSRDIRYRHYGFNVQQMVKKAEGMEDEEKKALFANAIGSYMKLAYKTWNSTHYVNDELIKGDLKMISDGDLDIPEEKPLDFLSYSPPPQRHQRKKRNSGRSDNKRKGSRRKRR